jgi:hypothetical protein
MNNPGYKLFWDISYGTQAHKHRVKNGKRASKKRTVPDTSTFNAKIVSGEIF